MRAGMDSAGPKIFATDHFGILDPTLHRKSRGFGDLEAYRLASLALRHRGAFFDAACGVNIVHLQADQTAAPELAINSHVEHRKIALIVGYGDQKSYRADSCRSLFFRRPIFFEEQ